MPDYQAIEIARLSSGTGLELARSQKTRKFYSSTVTEDLAHAPFAKTHYSKRKSSATLDTNMGPNELSIWWF